MSIFDSLRRNIKNVFVGSHKGEDIKGEWFNTPHPHDIMPIANGSNRYAPPEKLSELESMNPRPEEKVADWFNEEPDQTKEKKTPHHIAYEIATGKNNPFAVGGSENIHDFDSVGGSEEARK